MTKIKLIFTLLIITMAFSIAAAQDEPLPANDSERPIVAEMRDLRLGQILELTQEQRIQVRKINLRTRPEMRAAQQRFRQAKDDLDTAIYSDVADEVLIKSKLREVVESQAELTRLRTLSEVAVRNILTPEQLLKFRNLRNQIKDQQKLRDQNKVRRQNQRRVNQNKRN